MLQRGLSSRPTGAVALLLLGAGYLLQLIGTDDHQNLIRKSLFGAQFNDALVLVQKTGATIDQVLWSWGELLESESRSLGCTKKERAIVQRRQKAQPAVRVSSKQIFQLQTGSPTIPYPPIFARPQRL